MTTNNTNLYRALTLLNMQNDADVPFTDVVVEHTKEECFEMVRAVHAELEKAGVGPYTLLSFKERCNSIARNGGEWAEYYRVACLYVEKQLMGRVSNYRKRVMLSGKKDPDELFW